MSKKLTPTSSGVIHHLPHRTRLRVPKLHRHERTMKTVVSRLKKVPGVKTVNANERTGSILIEHDEKTDVLEEVGTAVQEVASEVFEALLEAQQAEVPGLSIVAHLIKSKATQLDTKVASSTNNWLDLKMLMPVAMLGAGFYAAIQEKAWLGLGEIPAFVLFYYAYDSYMKFHGPSVSPVSLAERVETTDHHLENPVQQEMKRRSRKEVT